MARFLSSEDWVGGNAGLLQENRSSDALDSALGDAAGPLLGDDELDTLVRGDVGGIVGGGVGEQVRGLVTGDSNVSILPDSPRNRLWRRWSSIQLLRKAGWKNSSYFVFVLAETRLFPPTRKYSTS
jgi:hypothetical protein